MNVEQCKPCDFLHEGVNTGDNGCKRLNMRLREVNACWTGRMVKLPRTAKALAELISKTERVWRKEGETEDTTSAK